MSGINEVKARIEQARDQVEFYSAVEDVCIKGGYRFDDSETMRENADRAVMQGKPLICEALRFAGVVIKRKGWSE
jgi:hypothetical protein